VPKYQVIASAFVTIDVKAKSPDAAAQAWQAWRDAHPEIAIAGGKVLILQDPLPKLLDKSSVLGNIHRGRIVGK
jgi:hypothetical protein